MEVKVKIHEQIYSGLFFLALDMKTSKKLQIRDNEYIQDAYCGELKSLEEAKKEKEDIVSYLKKNRHTIIDRGISTMLHNVKLDMVVKLKRDEWLIADVNGKEVIKRNDNRVWEVIKIETKDDDDYITCVNYNSVDEIMRTNARTFYNCFEEYSIN
jgi:hypothetical protein